MVNRQRDPPRRGSWSCSPSQVKYQRRNSAIVSVGRLLMRERSWKNDVALGQRALELSPVGGRQGRTGVATKMEVEYEYQIERATTGAAQIQAEMGTLMD
jgi:hypothetical protein